MSIQSLGVGSGLDLEGLVQQLLQAERVPKTRRFNEREKDLESEISGIGQVKSKLSAFEDVLKTLQDVDNLSGREPTIENPTENVTPFSATPSNTATPGEFKIAIEQLARGSRIETAQAADGGFSSSDDEVLSSGNGQLTFKIGNTGDEFTIDIAAGTTLNELRDLINNDENNFGVNANIINTGTADGGARLVFTSDTTGDGNDLQIVNTNDVAELNRVATTDSTESANYLAPVINAQDAIATVDGIRVQSDTNVFDNAIERISFTAEAISEKDNNDNFIPSTLIVGFDKEGLKENVESFVEKFNELADELDRLTTYGLEDGAKDGDLAGDSTVRGLQTGLSSLLGSNVSESQLGGLFALGVEITIDGRLEIGTTDFGLGTGASRLDNALDENFDDIATLFNSDDGIATKLLAFTEEYTKSDGLLDSKKENVQSLLDRVEDDRANFEKRMESLEQTLRARYLSLDSTVAQLQQTGNALVAALSGLNSGSN